MSADSTDLQTLLDKQQITEMIYRYCRSVDRLDRELGHSIWHDDAIADYGDIYQGDGRGVIDVICEFHLQTQYCSHQISNILIQLDGDSASSETYVTANLRVAADGKSQQIATWTRYIDQWSRRDGRWGIDKRIAVIDFDEIRDVTPLSSDSRGTRDVNDPSYTVFQK